MIPAKYRGRVDIAVNGTYWAGAMLGAVGSFFLLNHNLLPENVGWRVAFFIGPVLGLVIIYLRRHIPESPRWMLTHGQAAEAERIVDDIEAGVRAEWRHAAAGRRCAGDDRQAGGVGALRQARGRLLPTVSVEDVLRHHHDGYAVLLVQRYILHLRLSAAELLQSQRIASVALLLSLRHRQSDRTAAARAAVRHDRPTTNDLLDIRSRGSVLLVSAYLFKIGMLTAQTHTVFWCVSFFFASAGASSAYLTVSEIFPLEVRGQAISYFFAVSQVVGAMGPLIFGRLVGDGTARDPLFWGYVVGAVVMIFGGVVALIFGVDAEGRGLEDITDPLTRMKGAEPVAI